MKLFEMPALLKIRFLPAYPSSFDYMILLYWHWNSSKMNLGFAEMLFCATKKWCFLLSNFPLCKQSRLASLGILESVTKLGPPRSVRKYQRRTYDHTCLRRSDRLKGVSTQSVKQGVSYIFTIVIIFHVCHYS